MNRGSCAKHCGSHSRVCAIPLLSTRCCKCDRTFAQPAARLSSMIASVAAAVLVPRPCCCSILRCVVLSCGRRACSYKASAARVECVVSGSPPGRACFFRVKFLGFGLFLPSFLLLLVAWWRMATGGGEGTSHPSWGRRFPRRSPPSRRPPAPFVTLPPTSG